MFAFLPSSAHRGHHSQLFPRSDTLIQRLDDMEAAGMLQLDVGTPVRQLIAFRAEDEWFRSQNTVRKPCCQWFSTAVLLMSIKTFFFCSTKKWQDQDIPWYLQNMKCAFCCGVNNWLGESALASENIYQVVAGILRYRLVQVADFDRPAIGFWRGVMVKTPQCLASNLGIHQVFILRLQLYLGSLPR